MELEETDGKIEEQILLAFFIFGNPKK